MDLEYYPTPIEVYYERPDRSVGHGLAIAKALKPLPNGKQAIYYLVDIGNGEPELVSATDILPE